MRKWDWIIFLAIMTMIVIAYDFDEIYSKRPQGHHIWRQCDGASLALNYLQDDDATMFSPRTHHLMGNEGKTMGELPIIPYIASKLYAVFGFHEGLFRCLTFLIYALGLLYLFRLTKEYTEDSFFAGVVILTAMSSVITVFYAFNFMPNAPSLGLAFCSWFHIYRYFKTQEKKYLYYFLIFISIASLLKFTALLSAGIVLSLFILERFLKQKYRERPLFNLSTKQGLLLVAPFVIGVLWIQIAGYYQDLNNNHYFSLDWDPIWLLTPEEQRYTWSRLRSDWGWGNEIIYPAIFVIGLISAAIAWMEKNKFWAHVLTLYLLASSAYVILFFLALKDHDYYMVNLIGYFPLSFIYLSKWVTEKYGRSFAAYVFFAVLLTISIANTDKRHLKRYNNFRFDDRLTSFHDITPFIRSLGIGPNDLVAVEGDPTHCVSLYLMNNKGWTGKLPNKDKVDNKFQFFKSAGAKYLIVVDEERTKFKAVVDTPKEYLGNKDNLFIYKLL